MGGDSVNLAQAFDTHLLQEWHQTVLAQPARYFRQSGNGRQVAGARSGDEIAQDVQVAELRLPTFDQLNQKEALVNNVAEAVNDPSTAKINPRRCLVLERIKACAFAKNFLRKAEDMPPQSLEKRMAGCDPFEIVRLGDFAISGEP